MNRQKTEELIQIPLNHVKLPLRKADKLDLQYGDSVDPDADTGKSWPASQESHQCELMTILVLNQDLNRMPDIISIIV